MALRTENGWYAVGPEACEWVRIPGAEHVSLQIQKGWPLQILRAFAADYHAHVEPLRDPDSACYTRENSVFTSNHKSATAFDLNWNSHPFQRKGTFTAAQMRAIRDLQAFYTFDGLLMVFWAGDWTSPIDEMHWQLGYGTYNDQRVGRFIRERIRSDGFSTYTRGGTPAPPPPPPPMSKQDQYALAVMAEGRRRGITPRGIQIAFSVVFVESNWKMYANSKVPESLKLPHDAVGSDHDSVGLFQQRCPMWGPAHVLMDPTKSAGLFYDRLAKMDYNDPNRLPGDFAADVQRPAAQYRGRYQERMGDAVALYNRLANVAPPQGDDELSAEAERKIDVIYRELTQRHPSRSPFRHLGEGPIDTWAGIDLNNDAHGHVSRVIEQAKLGHPGSLALLREVADADPQQYPDRQDDALLAQAVLASLEDQPRVAVQNSDNSRELAAAYAEIDRLRAENNQLRAQAVAPKALALADTGPEAGTTGQIIGRAYDVLQELRLADALPIEERAPLAALISVLQTKNGSEL